MGPRNNPVEARQTAFLPFLILVCLLSGCTNDSNPIVVDFQDTVSLKKPALQNTSNPSLKVAIGAMVSPKETFVHYRELFEYIGRKIGRPGSSFNRMVARIEDYTCLLKAKTQELVLGEIPPSAQIKLLRVLQTQSFERLGGEKTLTVQVHFLIDACFEKSEDYEDLLYWLKAVFDPSVVQESRGER